MSFLTAYLVEKSLSVDNLFVFLLIFKSFHTPLPYQHKVLFWGVFGAIVMRGIMIFSGLALVKEFHWMYILFGLFLLYSATKMIMHEPVAAANQKPPIYHYLKKWFSVTEDYVDGRFFVKKCKITYATPLFIVLVIIEITDLVFALDSIPAVIAITQDPFIVYTSNIFAILGLRSLYFAIQGLQNYFIYLHYGLSLILGFIGFKMLVSSFFPISVGLTLGFIALSLFLSITLSLASKVKH